MSATVYLIGAGPGDPGLMTVAGAEKLRQADVIIYDYLANSRLLDLCPKLAHRIYVGKTGHHHTLSQNEINALLVEHASRHDVHVVVRLKGGDPYVFGRGGEEADVLHAAGIPFVVIPGITSGIAAPAYAGIPVTHRDMTSTITLITGHEREDSADGGQRVNYQALAQLGGTLVFYMGIKSLGAIASRLIAGGMNSDMPVAVIRWGTHPHQQTVTATLATIAEEVRKAGIAAPAITIVGKVVDLRKTLNWFESLPLFGKKFLVTRTRQQASELSRQLMELGADVIEAPTIEITEPDDPSQIYDALKKLCTDRSETRYHWLILTSVNGVEAVWKHILYLGFDARALSGVKIAAVGSATAHALLNHMGIVAELLPEKFIAEEIASEFRKKNIYLHGQNILLPHADMARPVLKEQLIAAGAHVDDVGLYRTVRPQQLPADVITSIENKQIDWVTFTSASTAENFYALLPESLRENFSAMRKASIGPVTSAALRNRGYSPTVEANPHTIQGLVAAIRNTE